METTENPKTKFALVWLTLIMALAAILAAPHVAHAGTVVNSQSVYRFYDPVHGIRKYTTNAREIMNYRELGWVSEGVVWLAPTSSTQPVYQLTDPVRQNKITYTTSKNEYVNLGRNGWMRTGTAWYSGSSNQTGIYQLRADLTGEPFLTTDPKEYASLGGNGSGYTRVGRLCYGTVPTSQQGSTEGGDTVHTESMDPDTVPDVDTGAPSDSNTGNAQPKNQYTIPMEFGHYENVETTTTQQGAVIAKKHLAAGCGMEFGYYSGYKYDENGNDTNERLDLKNIDWDYNAREATRWQAHNQSEDYYVTLYRRTGVKEPGCICKALYYEGPEKGGAWSIQDFKAKRTITLTETRWVKDFSCYADANGNHNPNCGNPEHQALLDKYNGTAHA